MILGAFSLSLFGQGNTIDWRDGRPGVRVVTNSLQTGEIMGLIDVAGQAKAGTGDVARIEGELVTHTDDAAIHLTSNQVVRIAQEHGGGITNETDEIALAAMQLKVDVTNGVADRLTITRGATVTGQWANVTIVGDDGPGLAQPRGEDEGQKLRLVADLGKGDERRGGEEGFHGEGGGVPPEGQIRGVPDLPGLWGQSVFLQST